MPAANKSSVIFGDIVRKFQDAGIKRRFLIPVVPYDAALAHGASVDEKHKGKAPGSYSAKLGIWGGLGGYVLATGATPKDHDRWANWPTPNVGVLGLGFPAIDSDAESKVAAKLVEAAIVRTFGKNFGAAERERGKGHRRLFAFEADDQEKGVKTRHVKFTPKGDEVASKVDVIGRGSQYVAHGIHPSGEPYGWRDGYSIFDKSCELERITNEDVNAFIENLSALVVEQGGTMDSVSRAGSGSAQERNAADLEPAMSIRDCLHGLNQMPNSEENFPSRDDLTGILAAVKAALGRDAEDAVEDIREWAVNSAFEPGWCSEEYFDKVWESLGTVRVEQDTLERRFRREGMNHVSQTAFPDTDTADIAAKVADVRKATAGDRLALLERVSDVLAFRDMNTLDAVIVPMVRERGNITKEIRAIDWWKSEAMLSDLSLLAMIQAEEVYPPNKMGMSSFLRDMHVNFPDAFFDGTIMDPKTDAGDIVVRDFDGDRRSLLNVRRQPSAIIRGRQKTKNADRDREDVKTLLKLMQRMFGAHLDFELDTLAYMAQTGDRPGSMLFLVGDKGVGKSLYISMLMYLFDGASAIGRCLVDGSKLASESGRRFAYAAIEGCRIVSLREIPNHMSKSAEAEMTATFKNMCDRGAGGDLVAIEGKGVANRYVENVCRVVVSSNYADAIEIEEGDRRVFFVDSGITVSNRFSTEFYGEFDKITKDPERLAAFWRFLLARDIKDYNAFTAPPITKEKLHRAIMGARPTKRHFTAALAQLNASDRYMVSNVELKEMMHRMSVLEHENSGGAVDDVFDYRTLVGKAALTGATARELSHCTKSMAREKFVALGRDLRSGNDRVKIYVLERGLKKRVLPELENMPASEVMDWLDDDRKDHPLVLHPLEEFREGADDRDLDI